MHFTETCFLYNSHQKGSIFITCKILVMHNAYIVSEVD